MSPVRHRHHLNRTLVYGVLTLLLGLIYFGAIVLSQAALRADRRGVPARRGRLYPRYRRAFQPPYVGTYRTFIDRRFYRRRYDAAKTLAVFSARLREETDLDRLGGELVSVVLQTIQPEHAPLWLKPTGDPQRSESRTNGV